MCGGLLSRQAVEVRVDGRNYLGSHIVHGLLCIDPDNPLAEISPWGLLKSFQVAIAHARKELPFSASNLSGARAPARRLAATAGSRSNHKVSPGCRPS